MMPELSLKKINSIGRQNFINFVKKYLNERGIFCTSNIRNETQSSGLIPGHAYSQVSFANIKLQDQTSFFFTHNLVSIMENDQI